MATTITDRLREAQEAMWAADTVDSDRYRALILLSVRLAQHPEQEAAVAAAFAAMST